MISLNTYIALTRACTYGDFCQIRLHNGRLYYTEHEDGKSPEHDVTAVTAENSHLNGHDLSTKLSDYCYERTCVDCNTTHSIDDLKTVNVDLACHADLSRFDRICGECEYQRLTYLGYCA